MNAWRRLLQWLRPDTRLVDEVRQLHQELDTVRTALSARVRRLNLKPDDVIVLETNYPVSEATSVRLRGMWQLMFPETRAIVLQDHVHIAAVISPVINRTEDAR